MKKFAFFWLILTSPFVQAQQDSYPKGSYMNFEEIRSKSPTGPVSVSIEKRTKGEIRMNGGNDYELVATDGSVSKSVLKKKIAAYSDGDTLYLNCLPLKLQIWYAKVLDGGKFLVFLAGIPTDKRLQPKGAQIASAFGALGGAIGGASLALKRYLYIIGTTSGKLTLVTADTLGKLLISDAKLSESFAKESEKEDLAIQIKYLQLYNANSQKD